MKKLSHKSHRVLKLRKKVPKLVFNSMPESDFLLENGGNVREFLSPTGEYTLDTNLEKGQMLRHNMIGPTSAFQMKTVDTPTQKLIRKSSLQPNIKTTRQSIVMTKVDYQARFNDVMAKINSALEKAKAEEKSKESQNLEIVESKPPNYLKIPSKMPSIDQSSTKSIPRSDSNDRLAWYMSLRECPESENVESYMRIGPEINGLYTKVQKPNPNFKSPRSKISSIGAFTDLHIEGENKLKLEVEAVKKVGYEYLRPELLELAPKFTEEVLYSHQTQSENTKKFDYS